ncbi:MAG: multicopper oxidase domain-containing protein [Nitrospirae bacterium]|nr:multicopper oxidase domain-containing protein [Nitrospirota bacterium]MBI3353104.1 multicopper oxidase domain-containing protein [Nitrospirota bacterium]
MFTIKGIFQKGLHLFGIVSFLMLGVYPAAAGETDRYKKVSSDENYQSDSDWQKKLKTQIETEEKMEGRAGVSDKVNEAMEKLMKEIEIGTGHASHSEHQGAKTPFKDMATMQQMDRSFFLGPASNTESVTGGGRCPANAPLKVYDISAINVEITLNQWLDYHPGYMYVLTENIPAVRAEEKKNQEARKAPGYNPGAVTTGLQTDMIQPLSFRGNQGDCVEIILRNQMKDEDTGLHIHGSSMIVKSTGQAATMSNPDSNIKPGKSQTFQWFIRVDEQEGAHMFHSHVGREAASLGLIGAFMVEPLGSKYLDPVSGKESQSGWQMMIVNNKTANTTQYDFREFVLYYHEIGDESFRPLNRSGEMVPQRDPNTDAYRPSARAINYRSEPFGVNNLALQEKYFHFEDESMSYSAYTFADVPTALPRSYMGDPAKFRLVHGGGEVFHSHHPHGGTIRWLRQPKADGKADFIATAAGNGPVKFPEVRTTSDRVDVQVIGPSEVLDLQTECGSGLCQQLAGDFLFHCHVAHHYVAGMWSYWRVYNTLQSGNYPFASTDVMPSLQELPDRKGRMKLPVTSDQLVGKTMDWFDKKWHITAGQSDWSKPIPDINIKDWVKMMVPPAGQPGHTSDEKGQIEAYDATVWDWSWDGNKALGEPEATGTFDFPKYKSPMPGKRPPILFDAKTGKTAWPHFKPHFGKRVPFARHHGPAPWLEPIHMNKDTGALPSDPGSVGAPNEETTLPAKPGEQGRWSLCPSNAGRKQYTIHFIETPITLTKGLGNIKPVDDPNGLLYVLQEQEADVRKNNDLRLPLVYRANVYDCVDVILKSEWKDNDNQNFQSSKINIHPHFIQFDNQASDGVITGFSYEQSVRPFTMLGKKAQKSLPPPMNALLVDDSKTGSKIIRVKMGEGATPFHVDTEVMIGMEQVKTSEVRLVKEIKKDKEDLMITLNEPLKHDHSKNEIASVEYVRYRMWVDSDIGTVFWHDHAFGATTWPHGGVGAMIVEPYGSTYHNPTSGDEIRSGPVADIHGTEPIGYGVNGSFRELVVMPHDTVPTTAQVVTEGNPPGQKIQVAIDAGQTISFTMPYDLSLTTAKMLNGGTHTTGGGFNFRAESLARRLAHNSEPSLVFSSKAHQDPSTPLLRAYLGDTMVVRLLHTLMNESHVWHIAGHAFRTERYAQFSDLRNAHHVGIAERYDLVMKAGGAQQMAGDYLHYNGRPSHLSEGSWGIVRVLDQLDPTLKPLPGREEIPQSAKLVCPSDAPVKSFTVLAVDRSLKYNPDAPDTIDVDFDRKLLVSNPNGKIFMLEGEKSAVATSTQPMPLTLHVNSGDCIKVTLKNELKSNSRASFSADMLAFDPKDSEGVNVGNNPGDQTVGVHQSKTYTFYAPPQYGEFVANVWDWGNPLNNVRDGLFGAIVVGPRGAKYRHPVTGEDVSLKNSWTADVLLDRSLPESQGRSDYRDVSLFFQDEDNIIGTSFMPYLQHLAGLAGVNYRIEPWSNREEKGCEAGNMFTACLTGQTEPVTPTIMAHAGDPVRIHVFGSYNEQNQVFSIEGHEWPFKPNMVGADMLSSLQFGSSENLDVFIKEGAGGPYHIPGDYVWQDHRMPYMEAGEWGYLRVLPVGDQRILPLNGTPRVNTATEDLVPEKKEKIGPLSMRDKQVE